MALEGSMFKGRQIKGFDRFLKISHFLERVLMEDIVTENSLKSQLQIHYTCSTRIRSRK